MPIAAPPSGATEERPQHPESPFEQPPIKPERAEPAEPVDSGRAEPERVEPERVEPERVEPRDPDRQGAQEGTERPEEWRGFWSRLFGG
jgi:hypothetical protein